jgi:hypothetical protein
MTDVIQRNSAQAMGVLVEMFGAMKDAASGFSALDEFSKATPLRIDHTIDPKTSVKQLRIWAKDAGIEDYASMRKGDLLTALEEEEYQPTPTHMVAE